MPPASALTRNKKVGQKIGPCLLSAVLVLGQLIHPNTNSISLPTRRMFSFIFPFVDRQEESINARVPSPLMFKLLVTKNQAWDISKLVKCRIEIIHFIHPVLFKTFSV